MSYTHNSLTFKKLPKIVPPPPKLKEFEKMTQTTDFDSLIKSDEFVQILADIFRFMLVNDIKINGSYQNKSLLFNLLLPWRGNTHYGFVSYMSLIADSLSMSHQDFTSKIILKFFENKFIIPPGTNAQFLIFRNSYEKPPNKKIMIPEKLEKYKLCGVSIIMWKSINRNSGHVLAIIKDGNRWINCDNLALNKLGFYTSVSFKGVLDEVIQNWKSSYIYVEPDYAIFVK
jgi:hypothetical protein